MKSGKYNESDGSIRWYQDGLLHREDEPAIIHKNGAKEWWLHGQRHNLNGPAVIYYVGTCFWYIENHHYTEQEWQEMRKFHIIQKNLNTLL